jgi:primosomal protein N''
MANPHIPQGDVLPFPVGQAASERADEIEECLNDIGSIITLLHETVEGDRFLSARAWLAVELERNFNMLDNRLSRSRIAGEKSGACSCLFEGGHHGHHSPVPCRRRVAAIH